VYCIIEDQFSTFVERICVALFDFDLNSTSAVIYRQGVLGRALLSFFTAISCKTCSSWSYCESMTLFPGQAHIRLLNIYTKGD
jgi:hypothetical protein